MTWLRKLLSEYPRIDGERYNASMNRRGLFAFPIAAALAAFGCGERIPRHGEISHTPNGTEIVWVDHPVRVTGPEGQSSMVGPCWWTRDLLKLYGVEL